MNHLLAPAALPVFRPTWAPPASAAASPPARAALDRFALMHLAYGRAGGLRAGDDLAGLWRGKCAQPVSRLARWIVEGSVVSFSHGGATWVPLFQFDPTGLVVRPAVRAALHELAGVFEDWELAWWFVAANDWLAGQSPLDLLDIEPAAVCGAARADRYIARG